jgi:NAD+ synthase
LKIPERILKKKPTAGLWAGQTDEGELGLSYAKIDRILFQLVDLKRPKKEMLTEGFPKKDVEKIIAMIKASEFKRHLPPIPKISARTVGHDFLYPYDRER